MFATDFRMSKQTLVISHERRLAKETEMQTYRDRGVGIREPVGI